MAFWKVLNFHPATNPTHQNETAQVTTSTMVGKLAIIAATLPKTRETTSNKHRAQTAVCKDIQTALLSLIASRYPGAPRIIGLRFQNQINFLPKFQPFELSDSHGIKIETFGIETETARLEIRLIGCLKRTSNIKLCEIERLPVKLVDFVGRALSLNCT